MKGWIAFALVVFGIVGTALVVEHQRNLHERFLHYTWEAAYHGSRSEAEATVRANGTKIWATHHESENGCQYRRLFVKLAGQDLPVVLSSRTTNMWGWTKYGWEPWSKTSDEVEATLRAYIAGLDSTTAAYAAGWMKHHVD